MPFAKFVTINVGAIAANASTEQVWEVDGDFQIRHIYLVEKGGLSINALEVTIRIDAAGYTEDYVPGVILSPFLSQPPVLDIKISKGQKVIFGIRNNEAAARNLYVVLELWQ